MRIIVFFVAHSVPYLLRWRGKSDKFTEHRLDNAQEFLSATRLSGNMVHPGNSHHIQIEQAQLATDEASDAVAEARPHTLTGLRAGPDELSC